MHLIPQLSSSLPLNQIKIDPKHIEYVLVGRPINESTIRLIELYLNEIRTSRKILGAHMTEEEIDIFGQCERLLLNYKAQCNIAVK